MATARGTLSDYYGQALCLSNIFEKPFIVHSGLELCFMILLVHWTPNAKHSAMMVFLKSSMLLFTEPVLKSV